MNINIHYLGGFINLGMIALKGKTDANIFNQIIKIKLEEFKLRLVRMKMSVFEIVS